MERLKISETRRVRGLGANQVAALVEEFSTRVSRECRDLAGSRLTVLAGPTAVGKGTLTAWIREHHPEIWVSVSATTRAPPAG